MNWWLRHQRVTRPPGEVNRAFGRVKDGFQSMSFLMHSARRELGGISALQRGTRMDAPQSDCRSRFRDLNLPHRGAALTKRRAELTYSSVVAITL